MERPRVTARADLPPSLRSEFHISSSVRGVVVRGRVELGRAGRSVPVFCAGGGSGRGLIVGRLPSMGSYMGTIEGDTGFSGDPPVRPEMTTRSVMNLPSGPRSAWREVSACSWSIVKDKLVRSFVA